MSCEGKLRILGYEWPKTNQSRSVLTRHLAYWPTKTAGTALISSDERRELVLHQEYQLHLAPAGVYVSISSRTCLDSLAPDRRQNNGLASPRYIPSSVCAPGNIPVDVQRQTFTIMSPVSPPTIAARGAIQPLSLGGPRNVDKD